ncbi:MAG: geranylgeranylglycerol-phosphate geranylgeranyltransferase [Bacteroidales bacterium]|nr:geranylgeranylglycerol-phosphate geranylgeranyltransferase [Bacteroidales bacterium]
MGDYFRLTRVGNLLFLVVFGCLLRYAYIIPSLEQAGVEVALSHIDFALIMLAEVLLAAGGNALNDYFDVQTDMINRPETVVVGRSVDRRSALLCHVLLTIVGLFAGFYVSFVLRKGSLAMMFLGVALALWFYSTHFKRQMLVGNVVVALLVGLSGYVVVCVDFAAIDLAAGSFVTGCSPYSHVWYVVCTFCAFAFISNLGREIIKDMEDVEGDSRTNCRTVAVELGLQYSKVVVLTVEAFMLVILAVSLYITGVMVMTIYGVVAVALPTLLLMWWVWRGESKKDFHRASVLSKFIMLFGILSLVLNYFITKG